MYMTDHLDYESRDLSISYPGPEEEKIFALLLALGAKNGILIK